jgi:hypothetical protein
MSFNKTNSFCAFILLGTKTSCITDSINQLSIYKVNKIITDKMIIYQIDGFDFIFPIVNLNEIDDLRKINYILKDFINKKKYLESHILFFMPYMSPKIRQILIMLQIINTNINIVSYIPGNSTIEMYLDICLAMNIKSEFINYNSKNFQLIKIIKKIINNVSLCDLFINIFDNF